MNDEATWFTSARNNIIHILAVAVLFNVVCTQSGRRNDPLYMRVVYSYSYSSTIYIQIGFLWPPHPPSPPNMRVRAEALYSFTVDDANNLHCMLCSLANGHTHTHSSNNTPLCCPVVMLDLCCAVDRTSYSYRLDDYVAGMYVMILYECCYVFLVGARQ